MDTDVDVESTPLLKEDNSSPLNEGISLSTNEHIAITTHWRRFVAPAGIAMLGTIIWNLPLSHLISSISLHILSVFTRYLRFTRFDS